MAAMRAEAMAEGREKAKQQAETKGKGKGGAASGNLENEPENKWARDWRLRIIETLPHGNDSCAPIDADSLRSVVLELWDEVTKGAAGDVSEAALSIFSADAANGTAPTGGMALISDDHAVALRWSIEAKSQVPTAAAFGSPAEEVARIWLGDDAPLVAPAVVLGLAGRCFGEEDVDAAYKKLCRVVHPDKTRDLPGSTDAFKRVKDSQEECKSGIQAARQIIQRMEFLFGFRATPDEMLDRPQAQLFATSFRFLLSVIGIAGEGKSMPLIKQRAAVAFEKSTGNPGSSGAVVQQWFSSPELLSLFGTRTMRTSYDCAPKHYRAQFICALSRAAWLEEAAGELIREQWAEVFRMFSEIQIWRLLEKQLRERTWAKVATDATTSVASESVKSSDRRSRSRRRSRSSSSSSSRRQSRKKGRSRSRSRRRSRSRSRRRSRSRSKRRSRSRSRTRGGPPSQTSKEPAASVTRVDLAVVASKWAFVPAADILLTLGEGMVGVTFEGAFVYDRRKKSINGVWACVTPPPGVVHIDFEVRAFVQEFQIDDPLAIEKLLAHSLHRPNTKSNDIDEMRRAMRGAQDPMGTLNQKLDEIIAKAVVNFAPKGKGFPKGGKSQSKGRY
ncbi:unnamed protein product [Polarella glacialis]|nr:unnamed protein product [Polarella glacialis]